MGVGPHADQMIDIMCHMKNTLVLLFATIGLCAIGVSAQSPSGTLRISSPAIASGAAIPTKYACDGDKVNPALVFSGVPPTAKSLALIIDDPDVPKTMIPSGEFVHWLVWDISPTSKGMPEADPTAATKGLNGTGKPGYVPMCPPDREHRYFFRLFALDKMLGDAKIANKADLMAAMQGHIVGQAVLMGRYEKKK
jgi:Raf kinase inhibitor-like YbhB/YbcL family protein